MATIISDIIGGSNHYSSITDWEADTRGETDAHFARLFSFALGGPAAYNESVEATGGGSGGRGIFVVTNGLWNPAAAAGTLWTAGTADRYVFRIDEDNFTLGGGIFLLGGYTGSSNCQVLRVGGSSGSTLTGVVIQQVYVGMVSSTGSLRRGIYISNKGDGVLVNSSFLIGNGGSPQDGMNFGLDDDGADTEVYNCGARNVHPGLDSSGTGFLMNVASGTIRNCWSYGCKVADFNTTSGVTESHNVSGDSTAAGTGSVTGASATSDMVAPNSGNYIPKWPGNLVNTGVAVTGADLDYAGSAHNSDNNGREIGPINFVTSTTLGSVSVLAENAVVAALGAPGSAEGSHPDVPIVALGLVGEAEATGALGLLPVWGSPATISAVVQDALAAALGQGGVSEASGLPTDAVVALGLLGTAEATGTLAIPASWGSPAAAEAASPGALAAAVTLLGVLEASGLPTEPLAALGLLGTAEATGTRAIPASWGSPAAAEAASPGALAAALGVLGAAEASGTLIDAVVALGLLGTAEATGQDALASAIAQVGVGEFSGALTDEEVAFLLGVATWILSARATTFRLRGLPSVFSLEGKEATWRLSPTRATWGIDPRFGIWRPQ